MLSAIGNRDPQECGILPPRMGAATMERLPSMRDGRMPARLLPVIALL